MYATVIRSAGIIWKQWLTQDQFQKCNIKYLGREWNIKNVMTTNLLVR